MSINGITSSTINGIPAGSINGLPLGEVPAQGIITFTHTGASFNPKLAMKEGETADVLWTFSDSTSSTEEEPIKDFGSAAERDTTLTVTPWESLETINIGYDRDDGGSDQIEINEQQNVTAIQGLDVVSGILEVFCASRNPVTNLDLTNFTALHTLELYATVYLIQLDILGTTSLHRLCFETGGLTNRVDLTQSPAISDVRGARVGTYPGFDFAEVVPELFHLCCWNNPFDAAIPIERMPKLAELYCSNTAQVWSMSSHEDNHLVDFLYMQNNNIVAINMDGAYSASLPHHDRVLAFYNNPNIAAISLENCEYLTDIYAEDCNMSVALVDYILNTMAANSQTSGVLQLTGNSVPTATSAITILEGRNWNITVDS